LEYSISPIKAEDREQIIDIFNYYVERSFAAYPEQKLPYQAFDLFLSVSNGYPTGTVRDENGTIVGFGMLRAHNPMPVFSHTAEITYFLHPDHTGKGLGKRLLEFLETEGREKGVSVILANISSLNPGSLKFHRNNGFEECGRVQECGKKTWSVV